MNSALIPVLVFLGVGAFAAISAWGLHRITVRAQRDADLEQEIPPEAQRALQRSALVSLGVLNGSVVAALIVMVASGGEPHYWFGPIVVGGLLVSRVIRFRARRRYRSAFAPNLEPGLAPRSRE